jgi:hypothetical protein
VGCEHRSVVAFSPASSPRPTPEPSLNKLGVLVTDSASFTTVRCSHGKYYVDIYYPAAASAQVIAFAHGLYEKLEPELDVWVSRRACKLDDFTISP